MLTAKELDALVEPIVAIYADATTNAVNKMARELSRVNFSSDNWAAELTQATDAAYMAVVTEITRLNKNADKAVKKQLETAVKQAISFDAQVYKDAGIDTEPIEESDTAKRIMQNALSIALATLANVATSAAMYARMTFQNVAQQVRQNVGTGQDKNIAIKNAVKALVVAGLFVQGRGKITSQAQQVSLAVTQRTTANVQSAFAGYAGVDLVQVSAHHGARPTHQVWQGKIYSRSGTHPKYPDFVSSTGYGTVTGLHGVNCRHSFYPYIEGVSEKAYTKKQLYEMQDNEVQYNGESLTVYEATQKQRYLENGIRKWSDYSEALKSANIPNAAEQAKVIEWSGRLTDLLKQTGLPRVR